MLAMLAPVILALVEVVPLLLYRYTQAVYLPLALPVITACIKDPWPTQLAVSVLV
jgi:hypothetical protein